MGLDSEFGDVKRRVGKNIASLRRSRRVTQSDFAKEFGLTVNYVSLLENGHRGLSMENLVRFGQYFEVSPGSLIDQEYSQD